MSYVLILDDSELILQMLEMVCVGAGYTVQTATSFSAACETVSRETPAVIVSDVHLPDLATDPVTAFRGAGCESPVILVSGRPQAELDELAASLGAKGAVSKDAGMMGMAQTLPALIGPV
ncbi:MAG: response regulator [bacterium]